MSRGSLKWRVTHRRVHIIPDSCPVWCEHAKEQANTNTDFREFLFSFLPKDYDGARNRLFTFFFLSLDVIFLLPRISYLEASSRILCF